MLGECGDLLEVQSNGSGGIVAPLGALSAYASSIRWQSCHDTRLQAVMTQFMLLEEFTVFLPRAASFNPMLQ